MGWQNGHVLIENATFRLVEGVSVEEFLKIDARFQEDFAYQQKGLLRRTTARSDDGTWLVVNMWDSYESADAPKNTDYCLQVLEQMHRCIDFSTHKVERFTDF